jgi:endonuclease G
MLSESSGIHRRIPIHRMKLRNYSLLLLSAALFLLAGCKTHAPGCADHFAEGQAPAVVKENLARKTRMLCFEGYAVMASGVSRTPIWAAENLTRRRVEAARELKRKNAFHAEEQLPRDERAELGDYTRSGYDRGHMAPSGDMPTEQAQYESFSLANMIPQDPNNNQNLWEGIESATRSLALERGQVYVVSGPMFEGTSLKRLNGRVLVPTSVYKAIYDAGGRQAGAYVVPNAEGMEYETLSIAELTERTGIDPFPKLAPEVRTHKMDLPVPTPHSARRPRKTN